MRITHIISSLKIGGAETVLCSLVTTFSHQGHQQEVLFFHDGPHRQALEATGIKCTHITGLITRYDPVFTLRLIHAIRRSKPDVIHSALWAANLFGRVIGKILRIPTICALHLGTQSDGRIRNALDAYTLPLADALIAVSENVKQSVHEKKWRGAKRVQVIPNGINTEALLAAAAREGSSRQALGIAPDAFVLGCVGRFVPFKNQKDLIEACARLRTRYPQIHCLMVGIGPEEEHLRTLVQERQLESHVTFIVGQPAHRYFPLFDCFVQPSWYEGLSIALLEALAFGLPVIVTGDMHQHDVITHEKNGLVIAPKNVVALVEALEQILVNDSLRTTLATAGNKLVIEQYSLTAMAQRYSEIMAEALHPSS